VHTFSFFYNNWILVHTGHEKRALNLSEFLFISYELGLDFNVPQCPFKAPIRREVHTFLFFCNHWILVHGGHKKRALNLSGFLLISYELGLDFNVP
jgi:hypothetical protein